MKLIGMKQSSKQFGNSFFLIRMRDFNYLPTENIYSLVTCTILVLKRLF